MSASFCFDYLPPDVLSLSGYEFFQFVKAVLGEPEANLLNKICVKSTTSLLQIEDPLDIFNYDIDDEELEMLKSELSFKLKNKRFMVKPGIIAGFRSLKDALRKKANEQSTGSKGKRQQHQQQFSNTNSSSMHSLVSTTPTPPPTQTSTVSNKLSLVEHKTHVLKLIRKWCLDNKENFHLDHFDLEENVDFVLNIDYNENRDVSATVKCSCNKVISLSKNNDKIQVSNYYKHLQSNGCDHMKNVKKFAKELQSRQQKQHPSASFTSTQPSSTDASSRGADAPSPSNIPATTEIEFSSSPEKTEHNSGKRRLAIPSQKHRSAKRSRL